MALKRSNIEFSKRVFLDRLTTDAQALFQPADIDAGPGDQYEYAGVFDPFNFGMDADCSGADGIFVGAAVLGPTGMSWTRQFSTEAFRLAPDPNHGPFGSRRVSREELRDGPYPIKICLQHPGGLNSHMNGSIDGWLMESNGAHGACTLNHRAIPRDSSIWSDF
jgi:hypothetical protein